MRKLGMLEARPRDLGGRGTHQVGGTREREATGDMKLGIDFGTTRVVVAAVDRGNYPLLTFETREGAIDWFPPLVALQDGQCRYGWDAWAVQGEPGWTVVRSLKRVLEDAGADSPLEVDGRTYRLLDL